MKNKNTIKKRGYTCIENRPRHEFNPIKHIQRWGRNLKHAYQRIRYGYCNSDVWEIDGWFLNVLPDMLEDLKETTHGYPDIPGDASHAVVGIGNRGEEDEIGMKRWQDILSEMIFFLREANKDTCTRENPYKDEYYKASDEFKKKYGEFGDGLKTEEEKAKEKKKGSYRWYMPSDVPEYKEISDKYYRESREIAKYRNECKDKGLDLFREWFWNLWD